MNCKVFLIEFRILIGENVQFSGFREGVKGGIVILMAVNVSKVSIDRVFVDCRYDFLQDIPIGKESVIGKAVAKGQSVFETCDHTQGVGFVMRFDF